MEALALLFGPLVPSVISGFTDHFTCLAVGRPAGQLLFFISLNIWWNFRPVYSLVNLIFWPFVFLPGFFYVGVKMSKHPQTSRFMFYM